MRTLCIVLTLVWLAGCGLETASTAATAAGIKAKELAEAKKTQERAQQKINEAVQLMEQRAEEPGKSGGY